MRESGRSRGGSADLSSFFITKTQVGLTPAVSTPWVSYPDLCSAACAGHGGATWLQVTSTAGPRDSRPVVTEVLGPAWGYHVDDISLARGDLVRDVASAEAAWSSAQP